MVFGPVFLFIAALPASDYAGSEACRHCHAAEFAAQSATAHAHALAPSAPPQPGDWAFGAGVQAITFVRRLDSEFYLEEGRSWYRALGGLARTPGHADTAGIRDRVFDPGAAILRCFGCHSTGPLRVSGDRTITPAEPGVRCEVCHGPAAAHARDPARVRPRNPGSFTAGELNGFCGQCHRAPLEAGESVMLTEPWNARHQPLMLDASACFRQSQGRLTCLTCHSPHAPLERTSAAYDSVCGRCHAAPSHQAAVAGEACVDCHMPKVAAQPYLLFSNHRIAVYSPANSMLPVTARH